jgi:hypothetical protein
MIIFLLILVFVCATVLNSPSFNEWRSHRRVHLILKGLEVVGLWLAAAVGIAAIIVSNHDASEQWGVMETAQRPWAEVEIGTLPFPPLDLNSLGLPEGGVTAVPIDIAVTNVGHSPMFNVGSRSWTFLPGINGDDPVPAWDKDCDSFRKERGVGWDMGYVLFPGKKTPDPRGRPIGPHIPGIDQKVLRGIKPGSDGKKTFAFYVYGCVNYSFSADGENHQTRYLVEVWRDRSTPGVPNMGRRFVVGDLVQAHEIKFLPGPGGGIQAD